MNIRKFAGILSISILSIMLVAASAAAQEDVPKLPMIAYGDVKINGQAAPVNTIVTAYDGVNYLGTVKLEAVGVFEGTNFLPISEPGGVIQFLIQSPTMTKSVKAQQTFDNWQSGEDVHLSLTATYVAGNSGSDSSASGGGRGSTISGSGNDDSVAAGGSGDDSVSAKEKTQTSSEDLSLSTGSDGSEGSGFNMLLPLLAVILIAAVGVIYYVRSKNL